MARKKNANDNGGSDPYYSPIMAPSGNIVSGAAAWMVRIKASGGPSAFAQRIAEMAYLEMNAIVQAQHRKRVRVAR